MQLFLRAFLPVYWIAFIALAYVLPLHLLGTRHGVEGEVVAHPDPVMRLGESCRNWIFAIVLALVALHAAHPPAMARLGVVPLLDTAAARLAGTFIMLVALPLVVLGQQHLGASWRIGFDPGARPPPMVVDGIYRLSRNPIYLGLALSAVGFCLVLPNALTAAIAPLTIILLQVRVRVEERWLLAVHGEAYRSYACRTPRWLLWRSALPVLNPAEAAPPARAEPR